MWLASAFSRSSISEYWPVAVAAVFVFSCLKSPESGVVSPPSGPLSTSGAALATGNAGPAPGVAVAVAGGDQLMYFPGAGACAPAWMAKATTPSGRRGTDEQAEAM